MRAESIGSDDPRDRLRRREFLCQAGLGVGTAALASLLAGEEARGADRNGTGLPGVPHFAPKATRMISLFMSGGPSQLETFDYKPMLVEHTGEELPDSVRKGQRLTGMSANQATLPMAGSIFKFARHGESGAWVSELLPHTAGIADELCIVKSLYTEAINHDPAITFLQTGAQIAGRPSIGAWLSYGLGSENEDLPAFCVLITKGKGGQPLYSRLWGSGFLPSTHQGILFRSGSDPVLYLRNPEGISDSSRRKMLDRLRELHELRVEETLDPALDARISQYEMAYRMQSSVPEVADLSDEPESTFDLYGPDARTPGTFAANCLLARRLAERGVRFIQLFHQGWDHHGGLPGGMRTQCRETDQASAALVIDLKRRGLLDDTLVVWGGEFGRTNYSQGKLTATDYGRDHHPRCFTVWMAGGGVRRGISYGETDEFGYNVAENPVHVHDLHATILHLLGIDHQRLTFKYQGRSFRLTDVHGRVIDDLIAS
ncbi:DUF1501 domain-containing protein [Tautonia sociabilis]|uniref:DUF1501 domain-containing protein n=1 Tax=Tautonia sociabilis TaxID=2080755 RepID=A0A432MDH7_9BACT|nr:DUF1501 domain-containing protein [Tautonia sociabilis]RUL82776.1 DUF1501 domain-containing protein [Tautonia sociabilis]